MACVLLLAGCTSGAWAQPSYPSKSIRMLVISAPGGSTDILSRAVGQALAEALGQTVVTDNRPGAGGIIAGETTARAAPDGYTLLMTHTSHSVLPSLHKKLPYDPIADFAPVSQVALTHSVLTVTPSLPVKATRDLIALAKARPGKLNYAAGTTGSSSHLGPELLKLMAGLDIVHLPYKGTAAQITALISGEAQVSFITMPAVMPHVNAGRLRAIAVGSPTRATAMPDLPTVAESGVPGFDVAAWNGLLFPAKTPRAIVMRINAEVAKIVTIPEIRDRAASQGAEMVRNSPEEFVAYIKAQIAKWARVVKASGMQPD
jgi:tripartite-type tricarboxylate transporter receptor subunit TctC